MLEGAVDQLTPWFRDWGLLLILLATFLESSVIVASFFPGESILLLGGFLAAPNDLVGGNPVLRLEFVVSVAFLGAFAGDVVGYAIGRRFGRTIIARFGRYVFLSPERMSVLEEYFRSYGRRAVMLGRFAPFLRSVRTLVAGSAGMPFVAFVLPAFISAGAWAALVAGTGFFLAESYRFADEAFGRVGLVLFVLLIALFVWTWRRVRRRVQEELSRTTEELMLPGGAASAVEEDR